MARQPVHALHRLIGSRLGIAARKPRAHPYQLEDASRSLIILDSRGQQWSVPPIRALISWLGRAQHCIHDQAKNQWDLYRHNNQARNRGADVEGWLGDRCVHPIDNVTWPSFTMTLKGWKSP